MPWIDRSDKDPSYYREPYVVCGDENDIGRLESFRTNCIKEQEQFLNLQKELGKLGDRDTARFMKECLNEWRKRYKGACYALGKLLCDPSGDCIGIEMNKELAPYADAAFDIVTYPQI